jgi:heme oxygenase
MESMSNLKDLTWEHHKNAERQEFVKVLMSGNIDPKIYATYLWNQFPQYEILEVMAMSHGLFDDIFGVLRSKAIMEDFRELWPKDEKPPQHCMSTKKYLTHMRTIMNDPDKLMAHIYVRHMGDLSGGQMIKKKVPGSGKFYQFEGDVKEIKEAIRAKTNDSMADEARICFDYATELFKDMMQYVPK